MHYFVFLLQATVWRRYISWIVCPCCKLQ